MATHDGCKAVLVNLNVDEIADDRRQPPGGLVSIATYCSLADPECQVRVFDLAVSPVQELFDNLEGVQVCGIATYSLTYQRAVNLARQIRAAAPHVFLVAGGPHASALPEETGRDFDCVICGEGEQAFFSVLRCVAAGGAASVPPIVRADPLDDLDSLPFPDYRRFCHMEKYTRSIGGEPVLCLDSSRGCDHRCRFCNSRVVERGRWRGRSPESVFAEVRWHCAEGWRAFRWNDDNFLADRSRALQLCELLRPLAVRFRIFARAESLCDVELCRALAAAGCKHIGVGVETLSPAMLVRMGKASRVDRIQEGIRIARDCGISIRAFFIVGFPGETDATVEESINALQGLPLDEAVVYPCIPYPGSDLFARPDRYGIVWMDPDYSHYVQVGKDRSAGFVMRTSTFGPEHVRTWRAQYMAAFASQGIAWCDESGFVI